MAKGGSIYGSPGQTVKGAMSSNGVQAGSNPNQGTPAFDDKLPNKGTKNAPFSPAKDY